MLWWTFCASVWMNMFFSLLACMSRIRSVELDGGSIFNFLKSSQTVSKSLRHWAPPPHRPGRVWGAQDSAPHTCGRPFCWSWPSRGSGGDWTDTSQWLMTRRDFCVLIDHLYRLVDASPWPMFKLCCLSFYRCVVSVLYECWCQTLTDTRKEKTSHILQVFFILSKMSFETQELKIRMSPAWLRSSFVVCAYPLMGRWLFPVWDYYEY